MSRPPANKNAALPRFAFSDSVGKTLGRARRLAGLTLDDVASETKIQKSILKIIESDEFDNLPHSINSVGFIRRYARLLGLDPKTAAQKYLSMRGPLSNASDVPPSLRLRSAFVASRLFGRLLIAAILVLTIGYLSWQFTILAAPPRLNITRPYDNQLINGFSTQIEGKTSAGAEVTINGQIVYVDDGGNFSAQIGLSEGLNIITIEARNRRAKLSKVELSVLVRS